MARAFAPALVVIGCISAAHATPGVAQTAAGSRPVIGLALGGGSARGFAHVGVLRWFEQHHIPIDRIAGTSMGGLVGGAYAAGMPPREIEELLRGTDWDEMFGASAYRYKSIARKQDARAYPSRLEFEVRHGVRLPTALNNGQQVELLLSRIGAAHAARSFDSLSTPFRCIATDLRTAEPVVLDSGSLPIAMRATMSLPGVFPPVLSGSSVLVDGGAFNNVPADVVRGMGANVVIAVDVGRAADTASSVAFSVFGLVNETMDAMMRANTRRAMEAANVVIAPDLRRFSSMDWRRATELADAGYAAAEAMREELIGYAVDDAAWSRYVGARAARRRPANPIITTLAVVGADGPDSRMIQRRLERQIGRPFDRNLVEATLIRFGGLDRYVSIGWDLAEKAGSTELLIRARPRYSAPPLLMSTLVVENRTSEDFTFQWAARFLAYDLINRGSELRLDGVLGTDPSIAAELREPLFGPIFVAGVAGFASHRLSFTRDDAIIAQYDEDRLRGGLDLGWWAGQDLELRMGARIGSYDARVKVGNPGLPSLSGTETDLLLRGAYDTQDRPILPSTGTRVVLAAHHLLDAPSPDFIGVTDRTNEALTQGEIEASTFWSWRGKRERVFLLAGGGTSFGDHPLPNFQFRLGLPLRLDAFEVGEKRGDNYAALTAGYLHVVARLPDFLGGPVAAGGWVENGSAFDHSSDLEWHTQVGVGAVLETLIAPAVIGYSVGFHGERRLNVGFGRLFR